MNKITRWKSFDFGPETSVDELNLSQRKRKSFDHSSSNTEFSDKASQCLKAKAKCFDFHKIIEPKCVADLVVHAKKIQELEGWLKTVVQRQDRRKTDFLLLTGPAGSGKSCAVQIICKSMKIETAEWTNPVDIDYEVFRGPGQISKFLDFFTESKYNSLLSNGNNTKVLLVKDFPNALIRNPGDFFDTLENITYKATHPVIFICTDSSSNNTNLQRLLFPEEILLKYFITHFSFNSCAPTLLKRGLKRAVDILQTFPELFCAPSSATIDAIVASSMGDIRCAMNQLSLACLVGNQDIPVAKSKFEKSGSKRRRNDKSLEIKHMVRDETLGLFHGLGRVLNPKRVNEGGSWRLNCDIQKLVDEFSIQPSMFTSFLFENYLKYFGELNDIRKSSEMLSFSVRLMENWDNHDTLVVALWTAVLGLMVFNEHKASRWNQIKGPRKISKVCSSVEDGLTFHPTDRFYYNIITKTEKFHKFKI